MKYEVRIILSFSACIFYLMLTFPIKEYQLNQTRQCLKHVYKDYCLVLHSNSSSLSQKTQTLLEFYADVFGKVVICSHKENGRSGKYISDIEFENEGNFGYHCLALAVNKHSGYKGYFFGNDNMIINWWNFDQHNLSVLWQATVPDWYLTSQYESNDGVACQHYHEALTRYDGTVKMTAMVHKKAVDTYLENGIKGKRLCVHGWSGFFYVPKSFTKTFSALSHIAYKNRLRSEVAVPIIFRTLDKDSNLHTLNNVKLEDPLYSKLFWNFYERRMTIVEGTFYAQELESKVLPYKRRLVSC